MGESSSDVSLGNGLSNVDWQFPCSSEGSVLSWLVQSGHLSTLRGDVLAIGRIANVELFAKHHFESLLLMVVVVVCRESSMGGDICIFLTRYGTRTL